MGKGTNHRLHRFHGLKETWSGLVYERPVPEKREEGAYLNRYVPGLSTKCLLLAWIKRSWPAGMIGKRDGRPRRACRFQRD
jgi:hypothetical protein